jgi:putative tryptophan/tyrosine transport system substrate-binding protein
MKIYRLILFIIAALLFLAPISLAQTGKFYRVGFLTLGGFAPNTNVGMLTDEVVQHLARSGFTSGVNLEIVKRGAEGHYERLPDLMAELVAAKVDVVVTFSYPAAAAAKEGSSTVPIVTFGTGDPLKTHLVASLNRPGGNITGISQSPASSRRNASNS